jgi:shikimate dehydrogenase
MRYHFGLIGQDIGYSKSPDLFKTMFSLSGVEGDFDILDIPPSDLSPTMTAAKTGTFGGLAVTVPYKKAVLEWLESVDPVATQLDVVNSIVIQSGRMSGHNTDWEGFGEALRRTAKGFNGNHAVILGYGGSARAVAFSLWRTFGVLQFAIVGRDPMHLDTYVQWLKGLDARIEAVKIEFNQEYQDALARTALIANCTPLGGWHLPDRPPITHFSHVQRGVVYCDLNYNPNNRTVKQARAVGLNATDGSLMLSAQAVRSFELWTGIHLEIEPVHRAVFGAV